MDGEQYEGAQPMINSKQTEYNNRKGVQNVEEVHNITRWQSSIYAHTIEREQLVSRCEKRGTKVSTHIL